MQTPFCSSHRKTEIILDSAPSWRTRYVCLRSPATFGGREPANHPPTLLNPVQETIIYTVSGQGSLLSQPKGDDEEPERHELGPGDFAFIPAWTEHQAVNESDSDFHLVIIRSGGSPVEVDLTGWGGSQVKDTAKR
jgi:oxalate decarboxylase/phosphoglucose isomerase-like protein (cupin superfamily)